MIGVDEAINTVQEAVRYAYERAADVFVLKLVKTGGIQNAVTISEIAASAGIRCVVTSTYDTQINGAVCLHLASSFRYLRCPMISPAMRPSRICRYMSCAEGWLFDGWR